MNEDVDETYRRASALDPSRPSEALRRRVLEHAAALAAERSAEPGRADGGPPRTTTRPARRRQAIFGTLAAAALAGLLIVPRFFNPHPPAASTADTAAHPTPPATAAPTTATPAAASPPSPASQPSPVSPPSTPSQLLMPEAADQHLIAGSDRPALAPMEEQSMAKAMPRAADGTRAAAQRAAPPTEAGAALRRAAEIGDIPALQDLTTKQFDVDARDPDGRTALILAALHGQAKSVDVLLAHGADPNAVDANGTTPLKAALAADQPAIVAALRRAGAR